MSLSIATPSPVGTLPAGPPARSPVASRLVFALLVLLSVAPRAVAETDDLGLLGSRVMDASGLVYRVGIDDGPHPFVMVFLDIACPISNRYGPRLSELAAEAEEAGVLFYGVLSDPTLPASAARDYVVDRGLRFPVLFDSSGSLAASLKPTHVPEAFVISKRDQLAYRGRIDDRYEDIGRVRKVIGRHDLQEAIAAVSYRGEAANPGTNANASPLARTTPVGCVFEAWDEAQDGRDVTYHRDVAPILNTHCVECHRPGDIGPFSLIDYSTARRRSRMIAKVVGDRVMPPWHAAPGFGHFVDERVMSEQEIGVLQAWAEQGAPEGDATEGLPALAKPVPGWRLGEPDYIVEMPSDYEVPASGEDIYRYFVIPSELIDDQSVVAVDFRPGDPTVVHHCIAYLDPNGRAADLDDEDPGLGFSVFGEESGSFGDDLSVQTVAGWAPGAQPYQLPKGLAMRLPPEGDFVLEIHYHLTGKATKDRSQLGLYFAKEPVKAYVDSLVIGTENIDIDPGEPDYRRHVWMDVPADMSVIDVSPHMHYLGKEVEAVATLPDGTKKPLIRIDRWDFRWQDTYIYREPVFLPRGSRIDVRFSFDNSADNPFNPVSPPERVKEGWQTTDEMCLFYFTVLPKRARDMETLQWAMLASFMRSGEG